MMFMEPSNLIDQKEFIIPLNIDSKKTELKVKIKGFGCQNLLGMGESCQWITEPQSLSDIKSQTNIVPNELLLSCIASYASLEMLSAIKENHISLIDFNVEAEADFTDDVFLNPYLVKLHYTFEGENINPKDIDSLVTKSTERCKLTNLHINNIQIVSDFKIEYPD